MNNEIRLIGNVVFDPDLYESTNGKNFGKMRVATNTKFGDVERSCFINVKMFGRAFKDFEYYEVEKGDKVVITGELVQEEWEKDGEKRTDYVVYANTIAKLHRKVKSDSSF